MRELVGGTAQELLGAGKLAPEDLYSASQKHPWALGNLGGGGAKAGGKGDDTQRVRIGALLLARHSPRGGAGTLALRPRGGRAVACAHSLGDWPTCRCPQVGKLETELAAVNQQLKDTKAALAEGAAGQPWFAGCGARAGRWRASPVKPTVGLLLLLRATCPLTASLHARL